MSDAYQLPAAISSDDEMSQAFRAIERAFEDELKLVRDADQLERFRIRWLGDKKGLINKGVAGWLRLFPVADKSKFGISFSLLKEKAKSALNRKIADFQASREFSDLDDRALSSSGSASPAIDVSLPGLRRRIGVEHPLTRTMREMVAVFAALGYSVGAGPEVETDFYNFEALNFPPNHPARDTQDTLVIAGQEGKPARERLLMRTHTSPVQIRSMVSQEPPLRIVVPGKVHRNDESDATHSPIFHQVEGLCVDREITFSDLKGTLDHAMKAFFGSGVKTRFFPSFFPFTEPSADVQISCPFCGGSGCRKCKHSGWIELLGCGMVDPAVFAAVDARRVENGLAPAYGEGRVSGFAFGMGVERIAMMRYGVGDIGQFYSGDLRFLQQFT